MTTLPARSAGAVSRGRLTDVERRERDVGGNELQDQIVDLAVLLGWEWLHIGALRTKRGWKTPTRGTLARWPDLTLARERDRRLIFSEVKRELEEPTTDQAHVLDILRSLAFDGMAIDPLSNRYRVGPRIEVHVWRPSDLRDPIESSRIYEVLR